MITLPCVVYLFKCWRNNLSHRIVTILSISVTAFNIATFVMRTITVANTISFATCPQVASYFGLAINLITVNEGIYYLDFLTIQAKPTPVMFASNFLSLTLPTIFLCISDAFLVSSNVYWRVIFDN